MDALHQRGLRRRVGVGCAPGTHGGAPRLSASHDPTLGGWTRLLLQNAPRNRAGCLVVGYAASIPAQLTGSCFSYVGKATNIVPLQTNGLGTWSYWSVIPIDPSIRGCTIAHQVVLPSAGGLAAAYSNGLHLIPGK